MALQAARTLLADWYRPAEARLRDCRFEQLSFVVAGRRGGLAPALINVAGISALALQWHPAWFVGLWAAATVAAIFTARFGLRGLAARIARPENYARCNALHVAASILFVLSFAAAGPLFWVPGDALNHLFLLLVLVVSGTLSIAQSGAHPPVGATGFIYLAAAIALCVIEGGRTYYVIALLGGVVSHMALGAMIRASRSTEAMLQLRASERALMAQQESLVAELRQANRAKAEFLAHMSHELRTPLNAVIGFSDLMRSEVLGPVGTPAYLGYLDDINASGAHLLRVISDILDMSKIEAGRFELRESEFDLGGAIEGAFGFVRLRAVEGGVALVNAVPAGLVVRADETALRQVALNVVMNAIKFTPAGGEVRVTAQRIAGGGVALEVADTGCGIRAEDLQRVFEPFGQGRHDIAAKERGTGLGLPIARNLMRAHGGEARLESAPGAGTRVILTLPAERVLSEARRAA